MARLLECPQPTQCLGPHHPGTSGGEWSRPGPWGRPQGRRKGLAPAWWRPLPWRCTLGPGSGWPGQSGWLWRSAWCWSGKPTRCSPWRGSGSPAVGLEQKRSTRIMIYKSNWFLFSNRFKGGFFQYPVLVTLRSPLRPDQSSTRHSYGALRVGWTSTRQC